MTAPSAPFRNYPSVCKDVVWQKHKTFVDKAKSNTKTGLGATLKAAEKAWAKINWAALDAKKLKAATLKDAQANRVKAQTALAAVNSTKEAVTTAHAKALTTKANAALSAGAKRQAEVIANGLKYALTQIDKANLDDFDAEIKRLGG